MALRFLEGFDSGTLADACAKWGNGTWTASMIAPPGGRLGGGACSVVGSSGLTPQRALDAQPTWVVGCAFRTTGYPSTDSYPLRLLDSATEQCRLLLGTTGLLQVQRGTTGLLTSTRQVVPNVWYYLEWKVTVHPSAGAFEVRLDGETWLAATGVNTRQTANSSANVVGFSTPGGSPVTFHYDDLYICDGTGARNNDFLGDVRVWAMRPSGAGAASDLAVPGGGYADYRSAVLADSPIHFWEMQETSGLTAADTGTSGTLQSASFTSRGFAAGPPGVGASATDFGASSFGLVGYQADLNLTADMTAEGWVWLSALPTTDSYAVSRGLQNAWTFAFGVNNTGLPRWAQSGGGVNGLAALPVGRWVHFVAVRAGMTVSWYVDGVPSGTASISGLTATSSTQPVIIGNLANGAVTVSGVAVPWPGRLAYLALYNSALTQARLQAHVGYAPWRALAEQTPDDDATYAASATVGNRSTFDYDDTPAATTTVRGMQVTTVARKDDTAARSLAPVVRSGGTNYTGTGGPLSAAYAPAVAVYETDPATGTAWTKSGLDGVQVGVEVSA